MATPITDIEQEKNVFNYVSQVGSLENPNRRDVSSSVVDKTSVQNPVYNQVS